MIILEQGVPSKRQCIMSLRFLAGIHELDSEPISEPELQLPLSSVSLSEDIRPSTGDMIALQPRLLPCTMSVL
uniref:Uncharacterized protein n=1 Tax=Tanacetum cinerariifolium TaxID=118510 RepID=A0A699H2P0_TANCI|nr:hypothetical protein [Tanacetum cinerariifolium]